MLTPYLTPASPSRVRLEIQKSVFIADLAPARSLEDAQNFWLARQKESRDATHHCFACRVGVTQPLEKSSDDGEPQGTAGHPMLRVLQTRQLTDAVLIVTRWFGGIKLGAGGLTRAYSGAAALAVEKAPLVRMTPYLSVTLTLPYDALGLFERYAESFALRISGREFTDTVKISLLALPETWPACQKQLTDLTAGRVRVEEGEETYVALPVSDGENV